MSNPKVLFVGGLEEQVNEAILHSAFIPFGEIINIQIVMENSGLKHKGFGFVEFEDADDAEQAIANMNNAEFYNRILTVSVAKPNKANK